MNKNDDWLTEDNDKLKIRKATSRVLLVSFVSIVVIVGIGIYLILTGFQNIMAGLCGNEILSRSQQPQHGDYDLVYFQRNCGATTGYSYHLSIIKSGEALDNAGGNIFISKHEYVVKWIETHTIEVNQNTEEEYKKIQDFIGIHIVFR